MQAATTNYAETERPPMPLTVTHVLEHLFCPRFTYYEYVLAVRETGCRDEVAERGFGC